MFEDINSAGIGVVVLDDKGEVLAALAERILMPDSVLVLETLAAWRAVQFVKELGFQTSIFEGDFETIINAIQQQNLLHSSFGHIIREVLSSTSSFQGFSFAHICRQGNGFADALAKREKFSLSLQVWMKSVLLNLYNCYLANFNI